MSKSGTFGLLGLLLLTILLAPCFALDLGISPPDIDFKINKGASYHGEIFIFGSETETTHVNIYKNDWTLTSAGNYQFLPVGIVKRSAASWITLNVTQLSLPPKAGQTIDYTLTVPPDASGSYWAAIMFSTIPETVSGKGQIRVAVSGRVAYIMRIDVNGSPNGVASIERVNMYWDKERQKIVAAMRIKNSGSSFARFNGRLELRDSQGRIVKVLPFQDGLVLPDSYRDFYLKDYDFRFKPGFYVALSVADLGDKSMKAVQSTLEIK